METTNVFEKNIIAYNDKSPLIINQGGTSSSKTYSILQLLYLIAYFSKKRLIISVCSYALPHLKLGAIRDFENILIDVGEDIEQIRNKTDSTYSIGKSIIEFFGTDNLGKVHGPRRDILFINEANYIKHDIYIQLAIRTRSTVFIDYNPTAEFWIHTEVIPTEQHEFIKSTYLDNTFLDATTIARIESRRGNENWWRVYGLGEIGMLEGAVFTNWHYGDVEDAFKTLPYGFGLDYGFFPDPDAMDKVAIDAKRKIIYIDECIHENNQGTDDLIKSIRQSVKGNELIVAESATPRTNKDLRNKGLNIHPVSKTRTVAEWLRELQDYEFILSENSTNTAKEFQNYCWSDKKAGVPVDAWNHHIDNIRYYYMYQNVRAKRSVIKSSST